jgi:O-antigen/teichoic acid export membrane protein
VVVFVLARLLTPDDYGVAFMVIVAVEFASIFSDPALGAALIQRPTIDERDRSTVFWMVVALGAAMTLLGVVTAPLVADFFGEPEIRELFPVASICCLVIALSVTHRALLARKLAYRSLEVREMCSIVAGGAAAIAFAVAGFGPWAVIADYIVYCVVSTTLVWVLLDWRPRFIFSTESARNLGGFSAHVFSATLVSWGTNNLDKVLIGRSVGASALGYYTLARNATQLPVTLISVTVLQAITPALSRIQREKDRLERAWLRNKRMSVALLAPALITMAVVAPDFVRVLYGEQWGGVVWPLRLLCLAALAVSLGALNWSALQARGEGSALLRVTLLSAAITWLSFVVGLAWGIVGVAACYAVARWLLVVPTTWMTTRALGFDFWAGLRAGLGIVPIAVAAGAVGLGVQELALPADAHAFGRLMVVTFIVLAAYAALMWAVLPSLLREMITLVREHRPRRASISPKPDARPGQGAA